MGKNIIQLVIKDILTYDPESILRRAGIDWDRVSLIEADAISVSKNLHEIWFLNEIARDKRSDAKKEFVRAYSKIGPKLESSLPDYNVLIDKSLIKMGNVKEIKNEKIGKKGVDSAVSDSNHIVGSGIDNRSHGDNGSDAGSGRNHVVVVESDNRDGGQINRHRNKSHGVLHKNNCRNDKQVHEGGRAKEIVAEGVSKKEIDNIK